MSYYTGINTLTDLQERRIKLLQSSPEDTCRINGEFMQAKDVLIENRNINSGQSRKKLRRIIYRVEFIQDHEPYVELRGDCICVSAPVYQIFNAEYMRGQFELPTISTPATMAVFIPPLTPAPLFCFI